MYVDYGNEDLNDLVERLRPRLHEYLVMQGAIEEGESLEENKPFCCINPSHEDKNPSMSFIPSSEGTRVRCQSCGSSADIFQAGTWLEGLPSEGSEWITENVHCLADQLEEDYIHHVPTEEELKRAKVLEMLSHAADCLSGMTRTMPDKGFKHTRDRGLRDSVCIEMGVGTVDHDAFVKVLNKYGGWERSFVEAHGVSNRTFGEEFITITLRNHQGVVVGFDRRYVHYDKREAAANKKIGKSYPKKFLLPSKSDIFEPSEFLYGIHSAKDHVWKGIDIVEGYFDVLSAMQSGYRNIVSACGTSAIKESHIDLMTKLDVRDICFVFDSDEAGDRAVRSCLKKFSHRNDVRMSFRKLVPPDGREIDNLDPDLFFRLFCKDDPEAYEAIPQVSAFRVALEIELKKGTEGEDLARAQIPHIACERDPLRRGKMVRELAEKTGCAEIDIRDSVQVIFDGKARNIYRDLKRDIDRGSMSPQDVAAAIGKAQSRLGPLHGGSSELVTKRAAKNTFYEAIDTFHSKRGALAGYRTGINFYDRKLGGFQKKTNMVVMGNPQSGKSAWMHYLINGLLRNYRENKDMCILMFSFDDSPTWSWAKQLACQTGMPIKWCAEPNRYILHDPDRARLYQEGQAFYREMIDERFRMFGGQIGMNLGQIKKAISNAQQDTGKDCIVFIDSFNKLHGIDGLEGVAKYEKNCEEIHDLVHAGVSVACTAETLKSTQGKKPTQGDLADTKRLSYNANILLSVYNPLHELREQSEFFWVQKSYENSDEYKKAPVVEIESFKDKFNGWEGNVLMEFHSDSGSFREIRGIDTYMIKQRQMWMKHGSSETLSGGLSDNGHEDSSDVFEDSDGIYAGLGLDLT